MRLLFLLLIVGLGLSACNGPLGLPGSVSGQTVVVSVAASLSDAVGDVANVFEKQTGIHVIVKEPFVTCYRISSLLSYLPTGR